MKQIAFLRRFLSETTGSFGGFKMSEKMTAVASLIHAHVISG